MGWILYEITFNSCFAACKIFRFSESNRQINELNLHICDRRKSFSRQNLSCRSNYEHHNAASVSKIISHVRDINSDILQM